jgi:hypothetical protein
MTTTRDTASHRPRSASTHQLESWAQHLHLDSGSEPNTVPGTPIQT